jgi:hypothetical protein
MHKYHEVYTTRNYRLIGYIVRMKGVMFPKGRKQRGVFENRELKRTFRAKVRTATGSRECCWTLWITSFIWTAYTEDTSCFTKNTRQVVLLWMKSWLRPLRWTSLNVLRESYTKHTMCRYKAELLNITLLVRIVTAEIWYVRRGASYVVCLKGSVNGTRTQTKQKIQTN